MKNLTENKNIPHQKPPFLPPADVASGTGADRVHPAPVAECRGNSHSPRPINSQCKFEDFITRLSPMSRERSFIYWVRCLRWKERDRILLLSGKWNLPFLSARSVFRLSRAARTQSTFIKRAFDPPERDTYESLLQTMADSLLDGASSCGT